MESKSLDKPLNQKKGVALVILATLFTATGITLFKLGLKDFSSFFSLFNPAFIGGIIFYILGATVLLISLKHGELSRLYPIISLSYVWTLLISFFFFHEILTTIKIMGSITIIVGISILGLNIDTKDNNTKNNKVRGSTK